jgi:hypothetical protein
MSPSPGGEGRGEGGLPNTQTIKHCLSEKNFHCGLLNLSSAKR